ncbi:diiron oxygenase [Solihabitans fulvus]|uniref:diiron oxygenase n=1 Tax=Solihabitans fulvus TaxID=1892852 RepID=UPI001CB76255|nr:diiron oxygenase [Solihabitans fulvus]
MDQDQRGTTSTVGSATLRRIVAAWPRRAAVANQPDAVDTPQPFDATVPDYPLDLVPFARHPRFLAATPEQRDRVLTGLWLGYNERVIATESMVAEPAFQLIMRGGLSGSEDPLLRQGIQQAIVDESFHTYLHQLANARTRELRAVGERPPQPVLVTYRRLARTLAELPERWERDIAVLTWGAVAETCINALLALVARDRTIQPMHSLITTLHLRDESAHGSLVVEAMRDLYRQMNRAQRAAVARFLPLALAAFAEQDPSVLRIELSAAGVEGVDEIIGDLAGTPPGRRLVRDFSGGRRIVAELGLTDEVDFDFPDRPDWSPYADPGYHDKIAYGVLGPDFPAGLDVPGLDGPGLDLRHAEQHGAPTREHP